MREGRGSEQLLAHVHRDAKVLRQTHKTVEMKKADAPT